LTTYDTLLVEQRQHVVYVTLNRPTALNALNNPLRRDLKRCFTDLQADPDVRVVVITGAGRGFCAGQDLGDPAAAPGKDLGELIEAHYLPLVERIRSMPVPTSGASGRSSGTA